jgi:DNA-binding CsgD family transcriptional regulator
VGGDLVSVIEAAYAEASDPDAWLRGVLDVFAPQLDRGMGTGAYRFRHGADGIWLGELCTRGAPEELVAAWKTFLGGAWSAPRSQAAWRKAYPCSPVAASGEILLGRNWREILAGLSRGLPADMGRMLPAQDAHAIIAGEPSGNGCFFFAFARKPLRPTTQLLAHWQRVAAHLVAGHRLARREPAEADAVLDPVGKVLHRETKVSSGQSSALSAAAQGIDRARGRLRRTDPERALDLWKGLVHGRWSLVDHWDHDGKRFLLAKRNTLDVAAWHTLTERELQTLAFVAEGQALKIVAYQLGVSVATVGADLFRAQSKLGLPSRLSLVTAYRARGASEEA